jgi:antitoxin (DNA-binding transcriptional repressor) of toxin-antitoxin stability system
MYDMKTASIRDLRHGFKKIERLLHQGEEIQITKHGRVIARLIPDSTEATKQPTDFMARLRTIYGNKVLAVTGAELLSSDQSPLHQPKLAQTLRVKLKAITWPCHAERSKIV